MKKTLLSLLLITVSVLVFGQAPPAAQPALLPDTVKIAVMFKNEKEVNNFLANLQSASNGIINSVLPSVDAQKYGQIISAAIQYLQQNAIPVNFQMTAPKVADKPKK